MLKKKKTSNIDGLQYELHTFYFEAMAVFVEHLKVWREDEKDGITWDQLQAVKNEALGEEFAMIEIYPPERRLVNDVNMRHLFTYPGPLPDIYWR